MSLYSERRRRFLEAMMDGAVAVFPTAPEVRRSNDTEYPFRPDSDFFYLTGFDEPEAWAVFSRRPGDEPFTLFVRAKDKERETWTGRRAGPEGAIGSFGADRAFLSGVLDATIPDLISDATAIYWTLGRYPDLDLRIGRWLNALRGKPRAAVTPRKLVDPGEILHEMRLFKTPEDLAILRRAVAVSAEAHREAMAATRPGMKEYEIQAVAEYVFTRRGARAPGYNSIVGGGANATVLHYVTNRDILADGELLLVDAGAEVDGFTGDITRTWPINGRFSRPQRALYEVVLDAQKQALAATKPGATIVGVHEVATRALIDGMIRVKLLEGSVDGNLESGEYKKFYMHRTSHWLGMDVHDVGDYLDPARPRGPAPRPGEKPQKGQGDLGPEHSRKLEPGMVITVEPGLYVAAEEVLSSAADPAFRGVGIRIEDDVLITSGGHEVLSSDAPKEPADVEKEVSRTSIFT